MKIKKHADRCEKFYGIRGEDIHEWIDQYFEHDKFKQPVWRWILSGWSPYGHRHYLHHLGALPKVKEEFKHKYSEEEIEKIFRQHLKDDYGGYEPEETDFENRDFLRRYHRLFF